MEVPRYFNPDPMDTCPDCAFPVFADQEYCYVCESVKEVNEASTYEEKLSSARSWIIALSAIGIRLMSDTPRMKEAAFYHNLNDVEIEALRDSAIDWLQDVERYMREKYELV